MTMSLDPTPWGDLMRSVNSRALLFGFIIKSVLFGMIILQAYQYFTNYAKDPRTRKFTIMAVCSLECVHFAISAKMMYSSLLPSSENTRTDMVWCLKVLASVNIVLVLLVKSFYLHLVWILAGNITLKRRLARVLKSISAFTFLYAIGIGVAFLSYLEQIRNIFNFSKAFERVIYITLASASAIDCVISAIISFVLFSTASRTVSNSRSGKVVNHLVLFFVGTGMLTVVPKILIIALYALYPSSVLYFAVEFSIPSLYTNSILGLFNSKSRLQRKMDASEELRVPSALIFGDPSNSQEE
ncbi:hypothetical protein GALMADRAFT_253713 [Galerina marginata CBS 339.88]|uniref:DUF6534 domain-containing protein n=1 Tax=Galerina marginata (strain CBS 339.88) TaxID=685588 RepID=A0A067SW72_GALM3|nr:hypothetical protein GALMADRAFT_253713 [Galerina marginata CBS 339.88]